MDAICKKLTFDWNVCWKWGVTYFYSSRLIGVNKKGKRVEHYVVKHPTHGYISFSQRQFDNRFVKWSITEERKLKLLKIKLRNV